MSKEPKSYAIMPDKLKNRTTGWDNPRDDTRTPDKRDPDMDRHTIGSNDPNYRSTK